MTVGIPSCCLFTHSLTPLCLALTQLCLVAGLRLPQGDCRKLTAYIRKAVTCLVLYIMSFKSYETIEKLDSDFNYANSEFVGYMIFDQWLDLVQTPLLEPYSHETLRAEPFFLLVLGKFADKLSLEWLDSSLGLDFWTLLLRLPSNPSVFNLPKM